MKPKRAAPVRPLLALAAAVLAAHLLLLGAVPGPLQVAPAAPARPFTTRSISAERPAPAAAQPVVLRPSHPIAARRSLERARVAGGQVALTSADAAARLAPAPPAQLAPSPLAQLPAQPGSAAPAPPAHDAGAQPVAFAIPGSMRLHYKVTAQARGLTLSGQGELVWHHDGDSYEVKLEIGAPLLPTRTQRSTGRITAQGLAPLRFSDKARSEEAAHFERDQGKVSFSSNRPDAPLLAGAQDRLSVLLQLGAMIAGDPHKFPAGATIAIQTAGTRDAELWLFTVEHEEELHLPGGTVSALKLTRNPRKEFDQKVELWLAPAMDYAPVRLRLTQPNADSVDQQWSSTDRG